MCWRRGADLFLPQTRAPKNRAVLPWGRSSVQLPVGGTSGQPLTEPYLAAHPPFYRWHSPSGSSGWWRRRMSWACSVTARLRSSSSTTPTSCSSTPAQTWTRCCSSTRSTTNRTRAGRTRTSWRWARAPAGPEPAQPPAFSLPCSPPGLHRSTAACPNVCMPAGVPGGVAPVITPPSLSVSQGKVRVVY